MNKRFIWTIVLLFAIGIAAFFIFRDKEEEVVPEEQDETVVEDVEEETTEEEVEEEYTGDTDFSSFSSDTQVLGEESEATFDIVGLENTQKDGYHEFVFALESEDAEEPFVTASYSSTTGVIRLDFQGISSDDTGIGYQSEESINKDGVLKIYHNVSADADQELYDIGVVKSTVFKLSSNDLGDGSWEVILQVKYPGSYAGELDMGSEEYSSESQSISGVSATEGASITSYTYGRGDGLLKFVWNVTSDGDNPIPGVEALYNADDKLVIVFDSLELDRLAGSQTELTLSSGISAEIQRDGERSIYMFSGFDGVREYKLSASLSPNQVILEIK